MGFEVNRFKTPSVVKVIPRIFCSFCEKVLQNPVSLATCGHIFCKACVLGPILAKGMCPEDRQPVRLQDLEDGPQFLNLMLGDLEVTCDFASSGCPLFVGIKDLSAHCRTCPFNDDILLECEAKCGASFKRKDRESHSCATRLKDIIDENKRLVELILRKRNKDVNFALKEVINVEEKIQEMLRMMAEKVTPHAENSLAPDVEGRDKYLGVEPNKIHYVTNGYHQDNELEPVSAESEFETNGFPLIIDFQENRVHETNGGETHGDGDEEGHNRILPKPEPVEDLDSGHFDPQSRWNLGVITRGRAEQPAANHLTSTPSTRLGLKPLPTITNDANQERALFQSNLTDSEPNEDEDQENGLRLEDEDEDTLDLQVKMEANAGHYTVKEVDLNCSLCQKTFKRMSQLMAHNPCYFTKLGIKGKKKMSFDCEECGKRFNELVKLRQHLACHFDDIYKCNHCGRGFSRELYMIQHIRMHTGERPFLCKYCTRTFTQKGNLKTHILQKHPGNKPLKANRAGRKRGSISKPRAIEPVKVDTNAPVITSCEPDIKLQPVASQYSMQPNAILSRLEPETGTLALPLLPMNGAPAQDEVWDKKAFKDRTGREIEVLMKRMEFSCNLCNKVYNRESLLLAHQPCYTNTTGVKAKEGEGLPFVCMFCLKGFSELNYLRGHLAFHVDIGIYRCMPCGKTFCHEGGIVRHNRVHTGDRPYKCFYCPKSFTQSNVLKDHLCIHTGEKPFKCLWPGCLRKFVSVGNRSDHTKRVHKKQKDKVCPAPGCGARFVSLREVKIHVEKHHSGVNKARRGRKPNGSQA